jgi:lipopolysaccharide transport protein LptA/LPS export ABC transporter protein LptC
MSQMPIRRRPPLNWLRRTLLAALVLLVGALGALFWFGRAGQRPPRPAASEVASQAGGEVTLVGEGFDYTLTEEERPIFRIRGESIRADRQDTLYLDGVGLTVYDPQGRPYQVESREASFSRTSNEGRLRGSVHLKGPSDLELRASVLQLRDRGKVLISPRPVWIGFAGTYAARAQRLRVYIPEEIYVLEGKVEVRSVEGVTPPVLLRAERAIYERAQRLLRIEENVELDRGPEHVQAQKLNAQLTADEKSLSYLQALGAVSGRLRREIDGVPGGPAGRPAESRVRFTGEELVVQIEEGTNQARKVELNGPRQATNQIPNQIKAKGGGRVVLETAGQGVTRTLTAARIDAKMAQGVLQGAQAFGGVEVKEASPTGPRRLTGQRADATFGPEGQLATLVVDQAVSYTAPDLRASGDHGRMDFAKGVAEFTGDPAEAQSERGRLNAPQLTYEQTGGLLRATGGVRTVLEKVEQSALAGTPLGAGEGPVRVQSQDALWRQSPRGFLFRGDVRAWRGENLLLAKELQGDEQAGAGGATQNRLTASGGVKSLWIPAPEGKEKGQPIEVTGAGLVYREGDGVLVYSGDVRVEQAGRVLRCNELEVRLGEDRKAETMTCTGNTRLDDPTAGRSVTADRAVYQLDKREIEMFGEPVVMRDKGGNQVRGKRLLYHIDDGKVEVKGQSTKAPPATPAVGSSGGGAR